VATCANCSGGEKVGFVGDGGTLTFTAVTVAAAGTYQVTISYLDGSAAGRQATVTVDGASGPVLTFTPTGDFNTVGTLTVPLALNAGANTIEFANPADYAPDFDRIVVAAAPN
jgi:hypothetical protein